MDSEKSDWVSGVSGDKIYWHKKISKINLINNFRQGGKRTSQGWFKNNYGNAIRKAKQKTNCVSLNDQGKNPNAGVSLLFMLAMQARIVLSSVAPTMTATNGFSEKRRWLVEETSTEAFKLHFCIKGFVEAATLVFVAIGEFPEAFEFQGVHPGL